jgi:hypothetical protein
LVKERAASLGIVDLVLFHKKAKEANSGNIINLIVRNQNRIYFASRSVLEGTALLEALKAPAVDIPSKMFKWIMAGKSKLVSTVLDKVTNYKQVHKIKNTSFRSATSALFELIDDTFSKKPICIYQHIGTKLLEASRKVMRGGYSVCESISR